MNAVRRVPPITSRISTYLKPSIRIANQHTNNSIPSSRWFSNAARDTRIAGRKRFYKTVDIQPLPPPWEEDSESASSKVVDSPISGGVDGTQSATGVLHPSQQKQSSSSSSQQLLTPRNRNHQPQTPESDSWYGITLDGKLLQTPAGNRTLKLPSSILATAIAIEWDMQHPLLVPANMPLTTLACTTLDQTQFQHTAVVEECLRYLRNDTTCYRGEAEDRVLVRKQAKSWDGLHTYLSQNCLEGLAPVVETDGVIALQQGAEAGLGHDPKLVEAAEGVLRGLDAWSLTATRAITVEAKSLMVALGVLQGYYDGDGNSTGGSTRSRKGLKDAVMAARVEEEFQIESWGLVEGGHDYDRLNCSIGIASAKVMLHMLRS
mmetsp:Transcript_37202/g.43278  ORF Transcript_37202/g.43278 Transcript_37202/m.43278 type:complete len:376 (-) Transcript_37202:466-1593(-)